MVTLGVCDYMIAGVHALGDHIEHEHISYEQMRTKRALAEGSVIRPKVSAQVKHGFANKFARLNASLPKSDRITPSLLIAQAALESDWGESELYKQADNPFGVKGAYHGNYMTYDTDEVDGRGKTYAEMSDFKQYPSLEDAVKDHNVLLKSKFLAGSHPDDYVSEAKALQNNGYATDPDYAQKLMAYVQNNGLTRFD